MGVAASLLLWFQQWMSPPLVKNACPRCSSPSPLFLPFAVDVLAGRSRAVLAGVRSGCPRWPFSLLVVGRSRSLAGRSRSLAGRSRSSLAVLARWPFSGSLAGVAAASLLLSFQQWMSPLLVSTPVVGFNNGCPRCCCAPVVAVPAPVVAVPAILSFQQWMSPLLVSTMDVPVVAPVVAVPARCCCEECPLLL